jgi:RNA polymerase sigma-70 factor (ECF subfamily)
VVGSKRRQGESLTDFIPSQDETPVQAAEGAEIMDRVRAVIATMPPRQRLIVELYDVEGASVAEIAELTGSAAATVRWHLHVGRRTLRAALGHLYRNGEDR